MKTDAQVRQDFAWQAGEARESKKRNARKKMLRRLKSERERYAGMAVWIGTHLQEGERKEAFLRGFDAASKIVRGAK